MSTSRYVAVTAAALALILSAARNAAAQGTGPMPEPGMGTPPSQVPAPTTTPAEPAAPPEEAIPPGLEPPVTPGEQPPPTEVQPPPPAPVTTPPPAAAPQPLPPGALGAENPYGWYMPQSRFGMSIMLGGGVSNYQNADINSNTGVAGAWDLRLVFGTRLWIGGEVAYVGAAQSINNLGLANSSTLVRNGLEGVLRINAPLHAGGTLLEPYVFGGVGWNLYDVNAATATADLNISDNTLAVPAGGGFTFGYQGFMADIRGTYRPTYFQELFINQSSTALTNWQADLTIGYEF